MEEMKEKKISSDGILTVVKYYIAPLFHSLPIYINNYVKNVWIS